MKRLPFLGSCLGLGLVVLSLVPVSTAHAGPFIRGDVNQDGKVGLTDVISILCHVFQADQGIQCLDAADVDDGGRINLVDGIQLLIFVFGHGTPPRAPFPECGPDPTEDALGCRSYPRCGPGEELPLAALKQATGCDEVLDELRRSIAEYMEKVLDENLAMVLEGELCWLEGGPWRRDFFFGVGPTVVTAAPGGTPTAGNEAAGEYSGTNTQVEGVDEADFVKNDGAYIYILADGRFQVIDAWPAPEAHRIQAIEIEGTPKKLFVHNDRAVIYSSLGSIVHPPKSLDAVWFGPSDSRECTYGYDCEFTGDGRCLKITVVDISDPMQPRLSRELEFNGSFLSARRIRNTVYTVIIFPELAVPDLRYWPPEMERLWRYCWESPSILESFAKAMFFDLKQKNLELIRTASLADLLPTVKDVRYEGEDVVIEETTLQDCGGFYLSQSGDGGSLLSLVTFAIDGMGDPQATTILGKPGAVYASMDSLYVATRHYRWEMERWYTPDPRPNAEATTVHQFRLLPYGQGSTYEGSGAVKGRILNQFSMDEYAGYLRIATTTGRVPSSDVHSTVSVLAQNDGALELVGQVDDIAPTEDIRSVRFIDDVGYVVTFKKTDPLFVIDLSDPGNPEIRGELKIPGYSTYMHPLDETHLLSIGYDADDQGSFAWFQGILLQIFDVGDLSDPRLIHKEVIGTRGSTSDAATNHLAFNYFRPRSLLAIPMVVCEAGEGGSYGDRMTFSGLMVYRVDLESGFEYLGGIPHTEPGGEGDAQFNCSNWWTRSNSQVKRSIFMDDYVFSVALDLIKVSHLDLLEEPVAIIPLGE